MSHCCKRCRILFYTIRRLSLYNVFFYMNDQAVVSIFIVKSQSFLATDCCIEKQGAYYG